ncbi:MAG: hypothetical protein STHCBS139747_000005 [Sporothrix thermara]
MATTLHAALWEHCLAAAGQIAQDHATTASLQGCGAPLVDLLRRQATQILRLDSDSGSDRTAEAEAPAQRLVARRLDDLVELAHARFYAYPPSDVPACWRQLYTDASILLFALRWRSKSKGDSHKCLDDDDLDSLVRPLDLALILAGGAGPAGRGRDWIHMAFDVMHCILEAEEADGQGNDNGAEEDGEEEGEGGEGGQKRPKRPKRPRLDDSASPRVPDFSAGPFFNDDHAGMTPLSSPKTAMVVLVPPVRHPVPRSGPLGLEAFQAYLDRSGGSRREPLVLAGMLDHWPAFQRHSRPWSSPAYLRWRTLRGRRLVPVEIGRSYVDDGWTQAIVPFATVLEELQATKAAPATTKAVGDSGSGPSPGPGPGPSPSPGPGPGPTYLAQHALFTQMPRLQSDIAIPDACYTSTSTSTSAAEDYDSDVDTDVLMNAWLGPPGTITPLHTDPHHNLLAQVVGRKYVRLYAPEQTAALRPRGREAGGVDMGNTSTVDVGAVEGWDENEDMAGKEGEMGVEETEEAVAFRAVPYVDCILEPGDTLYIPQGWWHYVRGLSVSFSVSFWWN